MVNYKSKESYQKILDAQKRGRETSKKKALDKYYSNPSFCMQCKKLIEVKKNEIPSITRNKKFCSRSCAAIFNNIKRGKSRHKSKYCINCGKPCGENATKYCSINCATEYRCKINLEKAKIGLLNNTLNDESARYWFRKISDERCSICGLAEWNKNPIPLVVDHIDGNHDNNYFNNFRMVCCNCDAQLPTYKSKNKGNGRKRRLISH